MSLGPHLVERQRGTRVQGGYGTVWDWSTPTTLTLPGCSVQPQPNAEFTEQRESTEDRQLIFCPDPNADVLGTDRLRWMGRTYEVVGHPERWHFDPGHMRIVARRVEG